MSGTNSDVNIQVKESINEASTKVLGKKVSKTKPWFNMICEEAVQRRKLARQEWLIDTNNEVTLRRFRTRQKEASKILRCEKRKYVQNILETAELDYKTHRTRDMYKRVNDLRGGYKKKEKFLRDDDGSLITTNEELAKKWARYFEKLLNCEEPNETFNFNFNFNQEIQESQNCKEPALEEIKLQINMLKNNKSPGEDDIQSELSKEGGEEMFQNKIIKLVGISILETFVKVKVGNTNSDPILVKSGLRQGDGMSPILFNIVVEKVVREMNITPQEGVKFQELSIGLLAYADDQVIMEDSQDGLKDLLNRLEKAAMKVGLHINEDKTEYMVVGRRDTIRLYPTLNVNNRNFKRTRQFKYLGSILSERNEIEIEIGTKIQSGNKCLYGLAKLLGSRSLSRELKLQLYITLIRPVITYGAEAWPLRKSDERKLLVLERKILRKIFGPVKDMLSGKWRIRKNDELETLFHKPSILETIKNKRLLWAGHAWRSQNPLIRMVLDENPNGKRPLGRPRRRWEDGVRDDVKALGGGEDWRSQASNREN
ncbi:hypothetical protein QTP88_002420 [Uroleucon formosanum]